jgi:hypothetical protein
MAISDITKNSSPKSDPRPNGKKPSGIKSITITTFKFNIAKLFWVILTLIFLVELYIVYSSIYKNVIFDSQSEEQLSQQVQRIDFPKYDRVVKRLDEVEDFSASVNINFTGFSPFYGRSNPFADPQQ